MRIGRRAAVAGAVAMLVASAPAPLADAVQPTAGCRGVALASPLTGEPVDMLRTPILLVHGINSRPAVFQTTASSLATLPRAAVYTFDYQDMSLRWVTDRALRERLADALSCLYAYQSQRVIVIGHSMGGLLTQQVASMSDPRRPGHHLREALGGVVTVGTPFEGSVFLTAARLAIEGATATGILHGGVAGALVVLARVAVAACGRAATVRVKDCPVDLVRILDSDAGRALQLDSPQLGNLPRWPSGLSLTHVAGQIRADLRLRVFDFTADLGGLSLGDVVVSETSALPRSGTRATVTCSAEVDITDGSAVAGFQLARLFSAGCFHVDLVRHRPVVAEVASGVGRSLRALPPSLVVQPDSGRRGTRVLVAGDGCHVSGWDSPTVAVDLVRNGASGWTEEGSGAANTSTDGFGRWFTSFQVARDAPPGDYEVVAGCLGRDGSIAVRYRSRRFRVSR